ncbi:MAG: hypothetical protein GOMPHAMPRED_007613 [Gomphillus americanus]|uniref:Uncharacterized protein n=1 Tax=Gomphillus americanus TaxID=1940652 RepID=A0A8H3F0P6_9LECA|nr:MAG: hypothetical protein GOMPHAMPRED_007613 [Gomphillus americanus]
MGKSFKQFCHFDKDEYRREISSYNKATLTALHQVTQQKIVGATAGASASLASTLLTGPIGLFGIAVSGRRIDVNMQRLDIIKERLDKEGWAGYDMRKRDYFKPVAITSAVAFVAPGADAVIGHFAGHAAMHAATNIHAATSSAAHHGATAAGQIAQHPETFVKAMEHGALGQVDELLHHTADHAANITPYTTLAAHNANALGVAAGETLAKFGEGKLVEQAASKMTGAAVIKTAEIVSTKRAKFGPVVKVQEVADEDDNETESDEDSGEEIIVGEKTDLHRLADLDSEMITIILFDEDLEMSQSMMLIADFGSNINARDENGNTALHLILLNKQAKLVHEKCRSSTAAGFDRLCCLIQMFVEKLLDSGANIEAKTLHGRPALFCAIHDPGKLEIMLDRGADVESTMADGCTALHVACVEGNEEAVRLLLKYGASVAATCTELKRTPLHLACFQGSFEIVKALVEGGADVNAKDGGGEPPLSFASVKNRPQLIKYLLDNGARADSQTVPSGVTTLYCSAMLGYADNVQVLLDHASREQIASVLALQDQEGMTAFHKAASWNQPTTVKLLSRRVNDVNVVDSKGDTALHKAARRGYEEVCNILIQAGIDGNAKNDLGLNALHAAANGQAGGVVITLLLAHDTAIEAVDNDGWTPLHWAAKAGHFDIVKVLLAHGASTSAVELLEGATPLHLATKQGHADVVVALVEAGASLEARSGSCGKTALHMACVTDHVNVLQSLIRLGADVNSVQTNSWTALHAAANSSKATNVSILLAHKADINALDKDSWNAIHFGCSSAEVVNILLDASPRLHELRMEDGDTALHRAIGLAQVDVVSALLARGADPNLDDGAAWTPLHCAASCEKSDTTEIINMLIAAGAHVNAGDGGRYGTPLGRACLFDRAPHVAALVAASDIRVNARDHDGWTPFHYAAFHSDTDAGVIKMLLDNGASTDIAEGLYGRTPLHIAVKGGKLANIKALLQSLSEKDLQVKDDTGKLPIDLAPEDQRDAIEGLFKDASRGWSYDLMFSSRLADRQAVRRATQGGYNQIVKDCFGIRAHLAPN